MKKGLSVVFLLGLFLGLSAQETMLSEEAFETRKDEIKNLVPGPEKEETRQFADSLNLPVWQVYPDGRITMLRSIGYMGHPRYLSTHNKNAAATISTNKLKNWMPANIGDPGSGMLLGIWDGGVVRNTHQEFDSRVEIMNAGGSVSGHATHVGGTMVAHGIDQLAEGMAPGAMLESYDWDADVQEMGVAARAGLLVSNHSYGIILGFDYNSEEERWQWWGNTSVSEEEEYLFGFYADDAQAYDQLCYSNPYYLPVKSAGNDRGDQPSGSEYYVWNDEDWERTTQSRQKDGGIDGFGCIGPVASAKNILAVGSVADLPKGYSLPEGVKPSNFSVFGPTDDGRIKPDVVANGESLKSSYSGDDSDYRSSSGTSMSSPNASGSMILLQQIYHSINDSYMRSASLKALILHTADDAGNPGPDYSYGWGLINTYAAGMLIGDTVYDNLREATLLQGEEHSLPFFSDGTDIKVSICWTDPAGQVPAAALNPADRILVNDLDLRLVRSSDGKEYMPFILDPVNPGDDARSGDNVLDNAEQIVLSAPELGFYSVRIAHKGELAGDEQAYSLVLSGLKEEFFASGDIDLNDNNGSFLLTSAGEYLPDMDVNWLIQPSNGLNPTLSFSKFSTQSDNDILRIYDGANEDAPLLAEFSGEPDNPDTVIHASGGELWIHFQSDSEIQSSGFSANWCTVVPEGTFLIEGEVNPCESAYETYLVKGQKGSDYQWTLPGDWNLEEALNSYARVQLGSTSGQITVLPQNNCGVGEEISLNVDILHSVPRFSNFSGDTLLCAGLSGVLTLDSLSGTLYSWMLPQDWLGQSNSHEIQFIPSTENGIVTAYTSNSCGHGDTMNIPVDVMNVPAGVYIQSLSDKICKQSVQRFAIAAREGESYLWSVERDWSILGNPKSDTVEVEIGNISNYLFVEAINLCGSSTSNRFFLASEQPQTPLITKRDSDYEGISALEIQNPEKYSEIWWHRDGEGIQSSEAWSAVYLANIPGLYGVLVSNNDGCSRMLEDDQWIDIREERPYSVHGGKEGRFIVYNAHEENILINIYDLNAHLVLVDMAGPGQSEIQTRLRGAYVVQLGGEKGVFSSRIIIH